MKPNPITNNSSTLLEFFDPSIPVHYTAGHLPHWRQDGVTYFVTFRLADSLPIGRLEQWKRERNQWLTTHPEPYEDEARQEYQRLFNDQIQAWLDAGLGSCVLRNPEVRSIVTGALRFFGGTRYILGEHVVMPNHVHAIVSPLDDWELGKILHSWKSYTCTFINRRLNRRGTLWQKESFDHIVRNPQQLERIDQYIRDNPSKGTNSGLLES